MACNWEDMSLLKSIFIIHCFFLDSSDNISGGPSKITKSLSYLYHSLPENTRIKTDVDEKFFPSVFLDYLYFLWPEMSAGFLVRNMESYYRISCQTDGQGRPSLRKQYIG